jgi:hypothetical protein
VQPYFITNPSSGKVLTIDGGICGDGANIIPGTNNENNWQKWMINYGKTIESAHCPGLVIGFEGTSCSNSASVVLATKSNCDDGQVWMFREDNVIVNAKCDTKAVDISGGTNIILWSIHGNLNQLWELRSASASPSVSPTTANPTTASPTVSPTTLSPSVYPTSRPSVQPTSAAPTGSSRGVSRRSTCILTPQQLQSHRQLPLYSALYH